MGSNSSCMCHYPMFFTPVCHYTMFFTHVCHYLMFLFSPPSCPSSLPLPFIRLLLSLLVPIILSTSNLP